MDGTRDKRTKLGEDERPSLFSNSPDGLAGGDDAKRAGPPNRMNDLPYREWMKFQKSFFRHEPDQEFVERCIYFFTKARWANQEPSRTLVAGFAEFKPTMVPKPRHVTFIGNLPSVDSLVGILQELVDGHESYDFVLLDLRRLLLSESDLQTFLKGQSDGLYSCLRMLTRPDKYCAVVVGSGTKGGAGLPLPWSVAIACRDHLRLRDEKVALYERTMAVDYCLIMQAAADGRRACLLSPEDVSVSTTSNPIPAWVIPKPPPRKKNEILHPAKFPETLIEEFVELFTEPRGTVFDPMAGTGSTIIAAIRKGRSGCGLELSKDYAEIARERIAREPAAGLFANSPNTPTGIMLEGDATRIGEIPELATRRFDYIVTSPPYWSMLSNKGSEYQRGRREKDLPVVYSDDERDLGNIRDYDTFISMLATIYQAAGHLLKTGGYLTVIVKNIKRDHVVYPLAWDLAYRLSDRKGSFEFLGNTLWCQDDLGLKPFAIGIHWVSNTLHNYCLHFRKVHIG